MPDGRESDRSGAERQRLDKWLWHARFARTRPLAVQLIAGGHVRVNGVRVDAPGRGIKRGDVLTLALARTAVVLTVTDFAERRGSAAAAALLYELMVGLKQGRADPS